MARKRDGFPPHEPPQSPEPLPSLFVDYDWEKKLYYLAEVDTKRRVAGPFATSFDALDHAANMRRGRS